MFKNYFKIAWRNLTRNKTYVVINIGGLALALAVFLIIILFVRHELSYNDFITDKNEIYRVLLADEKPNLNINIQLPEPIAGELKFLYPEVEKFVRVNDFYDNVLLKGKNKIYTDAFAAVGPDFFEIFDFSFISGNPSTAVSKPHSIVITKELAIKLFGHTGVMGETILRSNFETHTITGIIENLPSNTHFNIEAFTYRKSSGDTRWSMRTGSAYIKLHQADQISSLRDKIPDYAENHYTGFDWITGSRYYLILQPITNIHLYPKSKQSESSRLFYIKILVIVAALILLMACINYMNMATAHSAKRAREIGIRKTAGAFKRQIIAQIMIESAITCLMAFLLSLFLVELFRPFALKYFDVSISSLFEFSWLWLSFLIGLILVVGLLSGGYAAFYLSSFQPAKVLKGKGSPSNKGAGKLRKTLVVVQFSISIAIIIATLLIYKQMEFVRSERLYVKGDQVIVIQNRMREHFNAFKRELLQSNSISTVSAGTIPNNISSTAVRTDSSGKTTHYFSFYVRYDYLDVMGLDIVEGRAFSQAHAQDSTNSIIINETAAQILNIDKVKGQIINKKKLIGIVQDFHARTMFDPFQPVFISILDIKSRPPRKILVRLKEGQIKQGLDHIKTVWSKFVSAFPLKYNFLDEILDRAYKTELRLARIFNVFSVFSIIIACLGLFGLASFTAERRTKEIGIRKVLGATVSNIVVLLNEDFLKLVFIGSIIAVPIAWYFIHLWLQDFAYRIEIGIGTFLITGGLSMLIALITVSWQSIKAALANPVDSLKNE